MELYVTQDGSHTVISSQYGVPYHSIHGALQETNHVFITHGFLNCDSDHIKILEVGMGTGLNVLATIHANRDLNKELIYHALEPNPLSSELLHRLNYGKYFSETTMMAFQEIHNAKWHTPIMLSDNFSFTKHKESLQSLDTTEQFDLVYFDAFAPNEQPELWTKAIFSSLYSLMNPNACLVTYCAKGQVKRDLRSVGFDIQSLPGPPGKREMIRAIRIR